MLSTCINCYDIPELTREHFRYSMSGTVIPDEILIINDGGDPKILDEVKKVPINTKVYYIYITKDIPWNVCGAKNLAIFISRGDRISFEDADHIPLPDFYEKALAQDSDRVLGRRRYFIRLADLEKPMKEWVPYRSGGVHTMMGVYKRELLVRMKGFDERFAGHYGWDGADLRSRLQKLNCTEGYSSGYFMVTDGMARKGDRPMQGTKPKMEKENAWQLRRNKKEDGQVEHPILNFNYTITQL